MINWVGQQGPGAHEKQKWNQLTEPDPVQTVRFSPFSKSWLVGRLVNPPLCPECILVAHALEHSRSVCCGCGDSTPDDVVEVIPANRAP